jgi:hypothetical protein
MTNAYKTDRQDITAMLLKVAFNSIKHTSKTNKIRIDFPPKPGCIRYSIFQWLEKLYRKLNIELHFPIENFPFI